MYYFIYYTNKLFNYLLVMLILLIILYIFIKYHLLKNENIDKNLKIFGLFSGLSNREILLLAISTIRYIFLLWCLFKIDYTYILEDYHFWFLLLSNLLLDIINKKILRIPFTIFNNVIIYIALAMNATLYNYINTISMSFYVILIMILVLIFIFFYSTYFYIKDISIILKQNKYIKKKEKVSND